MKHRLIPLPDNSEETVTAARKILAVKNGVLAVEPAGGGLRVSYQLRQTCFADLLAELHSNHIQTSRGRPARIRAGIITLLERNERDNLISHDGWRQRVRSVYIACQSLVSTTRDTTGNRRNWQHYTGNRQANGNG